MDKIQKRLDSISFKYESLVLYKEANLEDSYLVATLETELWESTIYNKSKKRTNAGKEIGKLLLSSELKDFLKKLLLKIQAARILCDQQSIEFYHKILKKRIKEIGNTQYTSTVNKLKLCQNFFNITNSQVPLKNYHKIDKLSYLGTLLEKRTEFEEHSEQFDMWNEEVRTEWIMLSGQYDLDELVSYASSVLDKLKKRNKMN